MGPRHIHVKHRSQPVSDGSEDDELHEAPVYVSPAGVSPPFSVVQTQSQSGSSSHAAEYVHLHFPGELPEAEPEVSPYDSASRSDARERPRATRTHSSRRGKLHHRRAHTAPRPRTRHSHSEETSTESGDDSAEDFIGKPDYGPGMPRPQSYYGPNGAYTQSSSSGSYGNYPPVPHANQMVHYAPHQQHPQYHPHQYPPGASPPPVGYPPPHGYHPDPRMRHEGNNHGAPQYRQPPYGPGPMVHYGPQGYYPYGYPPPYPHLQGPGGNEEKAVATVAPAQPPVPQPSSEEIMNQMQKLLIAQNEEREKAEDKRRADIRSAEDQVAAIRKAEQERAIEEARIRAEAVRMAKEQAEAAAKAQAERAAHEAKIREEAILATRKAMAEQAAADKEQAAREARIREDAAREALEKAAADAKAKAEQAAKEAKIAADAAAEATSSAEKKAAEDAAAKEAAAKAATEEADKKMKEAEEAATKAKAEAEAANAAAAAAKPPDKKPPVRFKDAIGRNYNFPYERCCKWRDMENLIIQAFQHIEDLGEHVIQGRYDLIGPDKEIIMPQYWDHIIQPDMHITMMLWPLPEKPEPPPPEPIIPPPPDGVIDLDELLNGPHKKKKDKGKKPLGTGFSNWMLGGVIPSKPRKSAKKI